MKRISERSGKYLLGCGLVFGLFAPLAGAHAQTIYSFTGGSDGGNPPCGLISGGRGVLPSAARFYGTTISGGTSGDGTVYEVTSSGFESVLHSFTGGTDGAYPEASLIMDSEGNLYGTTDEGGNGPGCSGGCGTVFKVAPGGAETVLYSFQGGSDGDFPIAGLIIDAEGNLYGTTYEGGSANLGTVFKVTPGGAETVLHSFAGDSSDGSLPYAGLVMDAAGNFYGTTFEGGGSPSCSGGCGTVFKMTPSGAETVLHFFAGTDGALPQAGLFITKSGDLYGTTTAGGTSNNGAIFEYSHKGKEKLLYSFAGGNDGEYPIAGVVEKGGYLYGTTTLGGADGSGTVFKAPGKGGSDTVLHAFTGGSDGGLPLGGVLDQSGNLYGTTYQGGTYGAGVVFQLKP